MTSSTEINEQIKSETKEFIITRQQYSRMNKLAIVAESIKKRDLKKLFADTRHVSLILICGKLIVRNLSEDFKAMNT